MDRIQQLELMIAEDPDDSFLRFALAKEWSNRGAFQEAIQVFESLLLKDPEYVGCYYHYAKCLEEIEDFISAEKIYKKGIEMADYLKDFHAKAELQNALTNMSLENL